MYKLCPECKGKKVFGYRNYPCKICDALGVVEDETQKVEASNGQQDDGKQNKVKNTQNRKRKKTVDTGAKDSVEGVRENIGEGNAMGFSDAHLQEREEGGEGG